MALSTSIAREGEVGRNKVVYVDFGKGNRTATGGFGGGPRFLFGVFVAILVIELFVVAVWYASAISSAFFGPTVIMVAVLGTLAARRLIARAQVAYLYRKTTRDTDEPPDEQTGDWLH
jgi:hypothetical protein